MVPITDILHSFVCIKVIVLTAKVLSTEEKP